MSEQEGAVLTGEPEGGAPETPAVTVESLAAEMGWSAEKYAADPKNARSAVDWIKSTQANNRNLKNEMKELRSQVDKIAKAADRTIRREVEEQAKEIEARFAKAVEEKDTQGAAKAAQDMRKLEQENAPEKGRDYEADFARENPWYGKDEEASAYAVSVAQREAGKGKSPEEQLEAVAKAVRKRFPELFEDKTGKQDNDEPAQKGQAPVTPRNERTLSIKPKAKTFDDMPDAAKSACNRMLEAAKLRGTIKDADGEKKWRANYVRDYYADEAA